jgi:hypothetical protein
MNEKERRGFVDHLYETHVSKKEEERKEKDKKKKGRLKKQENALTN